MGQAYSAPKPTSWILGALLLREGRRREGEGGGLLLRKGDGEGGKGK